MMKKIQIPETLHREFNFTRAEVNEKNRTVTLAFSSEEPVERWFGNEILDHSKSSVNLKRITSAGPLLMDHNSSDQIGVIESVKVGADRIGRAVVRFSQSARGNEIFQDVLDGIRQNVSVGYQVHEMMLDSQENNQETYRAMSWEPYEISIVSIPADIKAGIGRNQETKKLKEINVMSSKENTEEQQQIDKNALRKEVLREEQKRTNDLNDLGKRYKQYIGLDIAEQAIRDGISPQEMKLRIAEQLPSSSDRPPAVAQGEFINPEITAPGGYIGLKSNEIEKFSFTRLIAALSNPQDRKIREAAAFELECSSAVQRLMHRAAHGSWVPLDVLQPKAKYIQRDLTTGGSAGNLVATNLLAMDFISLLRNAMVLPELGAHFLENLVGNVAIPRQSGSSSVYWVAENTAVTESELTIDQVTLSPKTVGTFTDISRKTLLQSSIDIEMLVRQDIATSIGLGIEQAAINGSGTSNQPLGILNTTGIGDVAGGTNGADIDFNHIVQLETAIDQANARVGNLGYLTNAKVRGKLKRSFTNSTYGERQVWEPGSILNDYMATVTNAMPSDLTKGTSNGICSAIIYGNWSDLLIGLWGGLDLTVDPYTGGTAGTVRVIGLQDVDIAVRHPESFAAMQDALTS